MLERLRYWLAWAGAGVVALGYALVLLVFAAALTVSLALGAFLRFTRTLFDRRWTD